MHTSYIHTYFIQPSLAHSLVRTGIIRCSRRSAEHQGAANHSCNKRNGGTNLESADTQEAAPSHWDHEGSRADADDDAQLEVKNQSWGNRVPGQIWLSRQTIKAKPIEEEWVLTGILGPPGNLTYRKESGETL